MIRHVEVGDVHAHDVPEEPRAQTHREAFRGQPEEEHLGEEADALDDAEHKEHQRPHVPVATHLVLVGLGKDLD